MWWFGGASSIVHLVMCAPCPLPAPLPPVPLGWSPFPGNINQLVIKLSSYVKQLDKTGGSSAPWLTHTVLTVA